MVRIIFCYSSNLSFLLQTPAERLRAKVKVLINKSDAKSTSDSRPNPVEVLELETDDFTPQSFMSKRTDRFTKVIN